MNIRIKSDRDFLSGLLFTLVGIAAIVMSRGYPHGTAVAMGPGYFPAAIGICLILIGLAMVVTSLCVVTEPLDRSINLRALVLVSAGLIFFGWGIERIGFIPSMAGLVLLGGLASRQIYWKELLILGIGIVGGSWLVFIELLDLPFKLFW